MRRTHLASADFVRAAACVLVLGHHLLQRLSPAAVHRNLQPLVEFGLTGSFGVAAFFVLSGYLLSQPFWVALDAGGRMPSLRNYAVRRAARIIPGFWLALTVSFVLGITLFGLALGPTLIVRYLGGLFLVGDFHYVTLFPVEFNGPLWSISFEVTSYALMPICLSLLFLRRTALEGPWLARLLWLAVICAMLTAHTLIARYWPVDDVLRGWRFGTVGGAKEWVPRFNPIGFFTIFAVGVLAAGVQVRLAGIRSWFFDALAILGLAGAAGTLALFMGGQAEGWSFADLPYGFPLFPIAIAVTLVSGPSSRFVGSILDNPVSRYVALISFGIYVWHYLVIEVVREVWFPRMFHGGAVDAGYWALASAIIVGITVVVAHLSYRFLEAPIIAWSHGPGGRTVGDGVEARKQTVKAGLPP